MSESTFIVEFGKIEIDFKEEILPYQLRVWQMVKKGLIQMCIPFFFFAIILLITNNQTFDIALYLRFLGLIFCFFFVPLGSISWIVALYTVRYSIIALSVKNNTLSLTYNYKNQIFTHEVTPFSDVKIECEFSYQRGNHHSYLVITHPLWGKIVQRPTPPWTQEKIEKIYHSLHNANRYYKMAHPK